MRNLTRAVTILVPFILLVGCGKLDKPNNETVKGGELVVNFSAAVMKKTLLEKGIISASQTVYGYKAYKIPYTTTDEEGNEVNASGLFVIPPTLNDTVVPLGGLSMVSDSHGTIFANKEAPSVIGDATGAPDGSSILLTSLGGFATLQADYIGFGDSNEHYHPFVLKASLANATVDFIRQVKVFASNNNITLNNQLFLTGYSEGGYAAMATLKKIEDEQISDLAVTVAAPMAGPYALKALADVVLSQAQLSVPSFMANVGYAYAKAYNEDIATVINETYASELSTLFDGSLTRSEIDPHLTQTTTGANGLFAQSFVTDYFTNPNNWFSEAVTQNNLHAWAPATPVRLVHCQGDDVIPYTIAKATYASMQQLGASSVELVPVESTLGLNTLVGHGACGTLAYKLATGIFAKVRKATKNY